MDGTVAVFKQTIQQAIISMLEFGITKEQIITRYTKEELGNAEAAIENGPIK